MKNLWIRFRLHLHRALTTSHFGYIKIALLFIIPLAVVMTVMWLRHCDIHGLYYFFNFNYPESALEPNQIIPTWRYLLIGIVGMLIVSGLLMLMFTNGVQRWVERIREGRKVFKWISNHYVMIGYNLQSINIINKLPINKKSRLIILTKKNPMEIRAELMSSLDKGTESNIIIYAGGREHIDKLCLTKAKECYLLVEGSEWESQYTRSLSVLKEVAQQAKNRKKQLKTNILIEDINAFNLFVRINIPEFDGIKALDIHPFNLYDNWARLLWSFNGKKDSQGKYYYDTLDFEPIENTDKHVHLVIVGFNSMGRALWQEAIRIAHYPNFVEPEAEGALSKNKTIITVIDPRSDEIEQQLRTEYPNLHQITDIEFQYRKAKIEDNEVRSDLKKWAADENEMLTIAICISDPDTALSMALSLPESVLFTFDKLQLKPDNPNKPNGKQTIVSNYTRPRILVRQSVKKPVNELLEANVGRYKQMKFFGNYAEAFSDAILDDYLAICVNGIYSGYGNHGNPLDASFYEIEKLNALDISSHYSFWESLWLGEIEIDGADGKKTLSTSEQDKLSTRYQIDHYRSAIAIQNRSSSPTLISQLAQTEHLRWIAERTLAGWRQQQGQEKRVNALKIHTEIIPYHALSQQEQLKDSNVVLFAKKLAQIKENKNNK